MTTLLCAALAGSCPLAALASLPSASTLKSQIHAQRLSHSISFESLLNQWERDYGVSAFEPLLNISSDRKNDDPDRYVAIMGAAKLGGVAAAPRLIPLLKDHSWMIRSGCLRALRALRNPGTANAVLPLLQDPALVVRLEAIDAIESLRPPGSTQALTYALSDESNYHGGKAQWVPQRALVALADFGAKDSIPQILKLLDHQNDPELQSRSIIALEKLTGTHATIAEWKRRGVKSGSQ